MSRPTERMRSYLNGLDRGQVMRARIVQVSGEDVHVVLGPGSFWARARGGCPLIGWHRIEIVSPGEHPVLKLTGDEGSSQMSFVVDASHEKAYRARGARVDRRA